MADGTQQEVEQTEALAARLAAALPPVAEKIRTQQDEIAALRDQVNSGSIPADLGARLDAAQASLGETAAGLEAIVAPAPAPENPTE